MPKQRKTTARFFAWLISVLEVWRGQPVVHSEMSFKAQPPIRFRITTLFLRIHTTYSEI
jgi:hypothetical protein